METSLLKYLIISNKKDMKYLNFTHDDVTVLEKFMKVYAQIVDNVLIQVTSHMMDTGSNFTLHIDKIDHTRNFTKWNQCTR